MILTVTLNAAIDKRYVVSDAMEGEVNRVLECTYTPGGKGLNVSKPAVIAGAKVIATGFVGGHSGQYIVDGLKSFNIESEFYHIEAESRSCINIWDNVKKIQTEYLEPGFTVTENEFQCFIRKYCELIKKVEVVVISGSVSRGLNGKAYKKLIKIAKDNGKKVILDTSGELLRMGIEAKPTMIKPNLDEIRMLTGNGCNSMGELLLAAKSIYERGIEKVVISLGAEGSIVVCEEGVFKAIVPKIDAVNTVGCGDAMIAGFAIGLSEGLSIEDMLRNASAISAASALRKETGFFVKKDMYELLKQIKINKIDY